MKPDGSVKLALNEKLTITQIYRNCYQMPHMNEVVDNVALTISGNTNELIWFSNKDLKYAYSQMALDEKFSRQCNFSNDGGNFMGTCRLRTGF